MKSFRFFYTILFSFVLLQTNAQTVNFFKDNIYNLNYNPASEITVGAHFSLIPVISNLDIMAGTNILTYNDIVSRDKQGNKVIDPKGAFSRISKSSSYGEITCNLNTELLGFGFKINPKLYFLFSSRLRMENTLFIPKGLFQLASDGNIEHIGEEMTIFPLASVLTYLDHSIGLQYKLNDKITVGARGKLLMGVCGANIKESEFMLMTDSEWNLHLKGSALANLYLPKGLINAISGNIYLTEIGSLFDFQNFDGNTIFNSLASSWGGGFDVGADIKLPLNFGIKASLIDMGWIKWNRNQQGAVSYRMDINPNHPLYQDGELIFSGLSLNEISPVFSGDKTISQLIKELGLDSALVFTETAAESYVMSTHPKLFLEGYYQLKNHKFSALMRMDFIGEKTLPSFTLAYNLNVKKWFDLALCYSMAKGSYRNLGMGFSFNPGNLFHFYVATDNLFMFFFPLANNYVNIQTGLFFSVPVKKPKKQTEVPAP